MRTRALCLVAAAVLGAGVVSMLTGCTDQSAHPAETSPDTSASPAADSGDQGTGKDPSGRPDIDPPISDRPPLGLEVRYVDEHGRFVTVRPEDFPR